jgi:hypothetical protein
MYSVYSPSCIRALLPLANPEARHTRIEVANDSFVRASWQLEFFMYQSQIRFRGEACQTQKSEHIDIF